MNRLSTASSAQPSFPSSRDSRTGDRSFRRNSDPPLAGSRVLVVEDEFIIALELQSNLENAGAAVIGPAYTVAEALHLAEQENLTAATLDLRLGKDSIAPVVHVLAERRIPFLFYTGQPSGDPVRCAWPQSTAISKPAEPETIIQALAEIIRPSH